MLLETRRFLHDIIADQLGLAGNKVVWSNQNGARQAVPLVSLMTYSHQAEAMEDHVLSGTAGVIDLKVPTAFVLEVRYFGDKKSYPVDILDDLIRNLEKPSVVDTCYQNGVAFLYADPVQDITTTLENNQQFEPAAAVDIHCRFTAKTSDDVGYIDTVEITGEIDPKPDPPTDPDGNPLPWPTVTGSKLIYGHIDKDGTVTDLDHAIPVNVSIKDD